eukprot:1358953-Heterocapsa_arctica.AAC.2
MAGLRPGVAPVWPGGTVLAWSRGRCSPEEAARAAGVEDLGCSSSSPSATCRCGGRKALPRGSFMWPRVPCHERVSLNNWLTLMVQSRGDAAWCAMSRKAALHRSRLSACRLADSPAGSLGGCRPRGMRCGWAASLSFSRLRPAPCWLGESPACVGLSDTAELEPADRAREGTAPRLPALLSGGDLVFKGGSPEP